MTVTAVALSIGTNSSLIPLEKLLRLENSWQFPGSRLPILGALDSWGVSNYHPFSVAFGQLCAVKTKLYIKIFIHK